LNAVGAVLAAGASRRLGVPKQLLKWREGCSLVRQTAQRLCAARVRRSAVIVGASAAQVVESLAGLDVDVVSSEDYQEGMAASIRAAAAWASQRAAEALLLCVCDQPSLGTPHLDSLLAAWSADGCLSASYYAEKCAVPAVFPARYFAELQRLRGDRGAASILAAASPVALVEWPEGELDVDTPSDWARAVRLAHFGQ
jgi:molybdenum cofactor cytidylyltransferase